MSSLAASREAAHNPGVEQPVQAPSRASAPTPGRGGVPPLRGALRQGRLPRRLHRALVPVRLRVRGVGAHVRRLHAEGVRGRDRPRPAAGGRGQARRVSAAIRATRRAAADVRVEVAACYESRGDELGCRNPSSTSSRARGRASACSRRSRRRATTPRGLRPARVQVAQLLHLGRVRPVAVRPRRLHHGRQALDAPGARGRRRAARRARPRARSRAGRGSSRAARRRR